MAELVYARHLKCRVRKGMWVRLPLGPQAGIKQNRLAAILVFFGFYFFNYLRNSFEVFDKRFAHGAIVEGGGGVV
ncbi:MAG: hypothetical protein QG620_549 [Patescibacteria group bacterium]|nr:hypothetical protein [Patescibacteria group bacterium]